MKQSKNKWSFVQFGEKLTRSRDIFATCRQRNCRRMDKLDGRSNDGRRWSGQWRARITDVA